MRRHDGEAARLILGIVPPLVGWIAIVVPAPLNFVLLAVAFAAQGAWDSLTLTPDVPAGSGASAFG